MLVLKPKQLCPYSEICPYVRVFDDSYCEGTNTTRRTVFKCDFVTDDGDIINLSTKHRSVISSSLN